MITIAINGASGRMGLRLVDLTIQDPELELVAALVSAESSMIGKDAGLAAGRKSAEVSFSTSTDAAPDIVIDFSTPDAADSIIDYCVDHHLGLVMATTRLSEATVKKLINASHAIPIVWSPNTSLAVNMTMKLAEIAAQTLHAHSQQTDVEIIERHHRFKADAPSGTALKFGEIISNAMDIDEAKHGREGMTGERGSEIGYHAIRAGDDPGQHTILFGMMGEQIELRVAASNRDCYARGALAAAKYLVHHGPGMYTMNDVLGL